MYFFAPAFFEGIAATVPGVRKATLDCASVPPSSALIGLLAAAEAARDDVRVFLIFWDEYHIEQFGSAVRAREQLERFVLQSFGPTDLVGLMDQLTPVDAIKFTRDRRALADHIHLLKGRRGVYVPTRSAIEEGHLRNAQDVERIRSQVTVTALKSAIMHLGTIRQGRYRYALRTLGEFRTPDEIGQVVLRLRPETGGTGDGAPGGSGDAFAPAAAMILLRDVARITDGVRERESIARFSATSDLSDSPLACATAARTVSRTISTGSL